MLNRDQSGDSGHGALLTIYEQCTLAQIPIRVVGDSSSFIDLRKVSLTPTLTDTTVTVYHGSYRCLQMDPACIDHRQWPILNFKVSSRVRVQEILPHSTGREAWFGARESMFDIAGNQYYSYSSLVVNL